MNTPEITYVSCPTCKKQVEWSANSPYRPFCSKRCQLIDLGAWASEENSIPSDDIITDSEHWSEENIVPFKRDDD